MKGIIPVLPSHRCILYIIFEEAKRGFSLVKLRKSDLPERCCRAGICVDVETAWIGVHEVVPLLQEHKLVTVEEVKGDTILIRLSPSVIRAATKSNKLEDFFETLKSIVTLSQEKLVDLVYSILRDVVHKKKTI